MELEIGTEAYGTYKRRIDVTVEWVVKSGIYTYKVGVKAKVAVKTACI